jgi:glycosyltransferase involved in cell wall biosynthesis
MSSLASVVIPCFNQAHFLGASIESALTQTYQPVEVVVVDDGATDNTCEIASAYPEVRCLRQPNQGRAAARNAGLRASRGEYVVFLDADDRLLPIALEAGVAALEADPEAAFAVGRHRRIGADGNPLPALRRARVAGEHYTSLVRRCWIAMPAAVMHRRAVLEMLGGFDPRLPWAEDYDLYLRIARVLPIVDHYTEVAEHRQSSGATSRNAERMLTATLAALRPHRPGADATLAHRLAWRARDNAVWYYDRLLTTALDDLAHGHLRAATRELATFAWHLPQHPGYAWRKLGRPVRRVASALRRHSAA